MLDKSTQNPANLVAVATCQEKGKSSGMVRCRREAVRDIDNLPFAENIAPSTDDGRYYTLDANCMNSHLI